MKIEVWCDGACSIHTDKIGGYACVIKWNNHIEEYSGAELNTTNNRMELMGAIEAFKAIDSLACHLPCEVIVVSDSQYVVNGMSEWLTKWKRAGWKTASNKPVKNQDLWQQLSELSKEHEVQWVWTQGHSNCVENNRCDELAVRAIEQRRQNVGR